MRHNIFSLLAVLFLLPALCLSLTGCGSAESEEPVDTPQITIPESRQKTVAQHYRAILAGTASFYSVDAAAEVTVEQLNLTLGDDIGSGVKVSAFSIADLNGDGEDEVLIWLIVDTNHSYGYTVLHHIGNTVYGYTVPYQSLVDLKRDGTFSFYRSANNRGSSSMSFTETGYELEKITYRSGTDTYFVDGIGATEEEFSLAVSRQSDKSRASWYHFNDTNIKNQFPT